MPKQEPAPVLGTFVNRVVKKTSVGLGDSTVGSGLAVTETQVSAVLPAQGLRAAPPPPLLCEPPPEFEHRLIKSQKKLGSMSHG
jgi:hypothetical protein